MIFGLSPHIPSVQITQIALFLDSIRPILTRPARKWRLTPVTDAKQRPGFQTPYSLPTGCCSPKFLDLWLKQLPGFQIRFDLSVLRELRVRRDSGIRAVACRLQ